MKKDDMEIIVREDSKLMIMLRLASEEGAKRALQKVGLEDEDAGKDIHDLRTLIEGYRVVKKTATKTVVQSVVVFTLGLISMGAYMKFWR
tara:strand:- start:1600 stop:1869 length:270 start_codon:yes stop_codon:yes gene_type:complete